MPPSPKSIPQDKTTTILADKISHMEHEIEELKTKLNDHSQIDDLMQRIANCESLAGIVSPSLRVKEEKLSS